MNNFVFRIDIVDIKYTETKPKGVGVPKGVPKAPPAKKRRLTSHQKEQDRAVYLTARQAKIGGAPVVRFGLRYTWEGPGFPALSHQIDGCLLTYSKQDNTIFWLYPRVNWGFGPRNIIHDNEELTNLVTAALSAEGVIDAYKKQVLAYSDKIKGFVEASLTPEEAAERTAREIGVFIDGHETPTGEASV